MKTSFQFRVLSERSGLGSILVEHPANWKGPGFNSTPDIISSCCVMLDRTKRYDNIIKHSITVLVCNLFSMDTLLELQNVLLPAKVPILDLYWLMSIELAPMLYRQYFTNSKTSAISGRKRFSLWRIKILYSILTLIFNFCKTFNCHC